MPMYNLLEYSKNYTETTGSLWSYYRDEPTSDDEINYYVGPKSFDFKSSIMGKLGDYNDDDQASKDKISLAIPLKHLSNFWKSLKMLLINCEIELILNWSTNCVILNNSRRYAIAATELSAENVSNIKPAVNVSATNATFQITDKKLHVPVVTLSTENDKNSWNN